MSLGFKHLFQIYSYKLENATSRVRLGSEIMYLILVHVKTSLTIDITIHNTAVDKVEILSLFIFKLINQGCKIRKILNLDQYWTPSDPLAQSCLLLVLVPESILLCGPGQEGVPLHVANLVTNLS